MTFLCNIILGICLFMLFCGFKCNFLCHFACYCVSGRYSKAGRASRSEHPDQEFRPVSFLLNTNIQYHRIIDYLLHLELDSGLDIIDLLGHLLTVGQHRGELASLTQTWTQNSRNLFQQ